MNLYSSFTGCTRYRFIALTRSFVLGVLLLVAVPAEATIVRYQTVMGDIDVRLYDTATPASVANFMNYLNDGDWNDSFIHRSVPGFVVQGGGFKFTDANGVASVPTDDPVVNEFGITNVRGTIAYAKTAAGPDSATSQWFFNLGNNAANLDNQNGGFTVFGRVLGDGMDIVDAIAALPRVNAGSPFDNLPVIDWNPVNNIMDENLVNITTIIELTFDDADYNFDGIVDAADYSVWRDSLGSTTQAEADGNGNGIVDQADYDLWVSNFAVTSFSNSTSAAVPEPAAIFMVLSGIALMRCRRA